jgi:uncharacterized membrane protein (GlpM family)
MRILRGTLVAVVVAGLAVDAYVHLHLASTFDPIRATISQGQLFRIEGYAAILSAAFLLIRPGRLSAAVAAVVAGGGLAAVLLYAAVDVGQIGPVPNMYDPSWSALKIWSVVGQAAAAIAAVVLLAIGVRDPATGGPEDTRSRAGSGAIGR